MIILLALHAIVLGALLYGAALLAADVLRSRNRNERWVWVSALVGTLALPPLLQALARTAAAPGPGASGAGVSGSGWAAELPELVVGPASAVPDWTGPALLGLWGLVSLGLAVRLGLGMWALRRLRLRSPRVAGFPLPLRRTGGIGPAIVGFVRPVILVPGWVLGLPREERDWILRHEGEHLRGRDPLLLALVQASRIALPWNPVVWLLGHRLLAAIELDCDRRTLMARRSEVRSYAEALLRVARRSPARLPPAAFAFAEREPTLEKRIRTMTTPTRPIPFSIRLALAAVTALALVVACEVPLPSSNEAPDAEPGLVATESGTDESDVRREAREGPTFTPMTRQPEITNGREVQEALREAYPAELRDAGVTGMVKVWFYVDARGRVQEVRLAEGSGHAELDEAGLEVARTVEFEPALNRDEPVAVWVQFPVVFRTR